MNNEHLSDETIQAYILDELSDSKIIDHISECALCKHKLETYRILFSSMEKIEPETFSFDTTALVMQKIEGFGKPPSLVSTYTLVFVLCILLLCVMIVGIPLLIPLMRIFQSITVIANGLILSSGLSVLVFLIIDNFRQYKQKERLISVKKLQPEL